MIHEKYNTVCKVYLRVVVDWMAAW